MSTVLGRRLNGPLFVKVSAVCWAEWVASSVSPCKKSCPDVSEAEQTCCGVHRIKLCVGERKCQTPTTAETDPALPQSEMLEECKFHAKCQNRKVTQYCDAHLQWNHIACSAPQLTLQLSHCLTVSLSCDRCFTSWVWSKQVVTWYIYVTTSDWTKKEAVATLNIPSFFFKIILCL